MMNVQDDNNENDPIGVEEQPLRSISSERPVNVCFRNVTNNVVDVYWIDFEGNPVHYKSLAPMERFPVNTYETHPWVFKENVFGSSMLVKQKPVFLPEFCQKLVRRRPDGAVTLLRILYDITLPVYSLYEIAAQVVVSRVTSEDDVSLLRLPETVKRNLQKMLQQRADCQRK